jgi:uncharacterized protein (DUF488 family)
MPGGRRDTHVKGSRRLLCPRHHFAAWRVAILLRPTPMKSAKSQSGPLVCTIGHSNRPLDMFIELLRRNEIVRVLDVRTVPRSAHNPQFNRDTLPASLAAIQIAYTYLPGLGGLRHTRAGSVNTGWRNLSFRGYADYMQLPEFADNAQWVAELASTERCALMCAEAVPWRCHRSMIGDALLVRGVRVEDIIGSKGRTPHVLTAFARVDGTQVTYPPIEMLLKEP